MVIFAVVPWTAIGVILTAIVSLVSAVFVFIKGRNSDKALASSTMVQTAFEGQKNLVEALQEEVARHAAVASKNAEDNFKCKQECDELKSKFARAEFELKQAKTEISVLKKRLQEAGISI